MHWALWGLNVGNLIRDFDTEAEALATARDLLASGWIPDDLGLRLEFDDGEDIDDDNLPPPLIGPALAARVEESRAEKGLSARPSSS